MRRSYTSLPLSLPGVIIFSMSALFPDTHPKAEAVLIGLLRQAPAWRKLEMVDQLNQSVKHAGAGGLTAALPHDS